MLTVNFSWRFCIQLKSPGRKLLFGSKLSSHVELLKAVEVVIRTLLLALSSVGSVSRYWYWRLSPLNVNADRWRHAHKSWLKQKSKPCLLTAIRDLNNLNFKLWWCHVKCEKHEAIVVTSGCQYGRSCCRAGTFQATWLCSICDGVRLSRKKCIIGNIRINKVVCSW